MSCPSFMCSGTAEADWIAHFHLERVIAFASSYSFICLPVLAASQNLLIFHDILAVMAHGSCKGCVCRFQVLHVGFVRFQRPGNVFLHAPLCHVSIVDDLSCPLQNAMQKDRPESLGSVNKFIESKRWKAADSIRSVVLNAAAHF